MKLIRLKAAGFRNLQSVDLNFCDDINLIYGLNGSGKTSLLEAIYTLFRVRSFRSRKTKSIIRYDSDSFTLFGLVRDAGGGNIPIGVFKSAKGEVQVKKAGERCSSSAELAELVPLVLINGHSFKLLENGPDQRRQFLDWLVFHVEHTFLADWKNYEKCLKQRNSLLRHVKIDSLAMDSWEKELAYYGERIHSQRLLMIDRFRVTFGDYHSALPSRLGELEFRYSPGWNPEVSLLELFRSNRERDQKVGYTLQGPHRADFTIIKEGFNVQEVLSRGQLKLLISVLYVAQARLVSELCSKGPMFLLDDLAAELDFGAQRMIYEWLLALNVQLFATGIEEKDLSAFENLDSVREVAMFHVEHGVVTPKRSTL